MFDIIWNFCVAHGWKIEHTLTFLFSSIGCIAAILIAFKQNKILKEQLEISSNQEKRYQRELDVNFYHIHNKLTFLGGWFGLNEFHEYDKLDDNLVYKIKTNFRHDNQGNDMNKVASKHVCELLIEVEKYIPLTYDIECIRNFSNFKISILDFIYCVKTCSNKQIMNKLKILQVHYDKLVPKKFKDNGRKFMEIKYENNLIFEISK